MCKELKRHQEGRKSSAVEGSKRRNVNCILKNKPSFTKRNMEKEREVMLPVKGVRQGS